MRRETSLTSGGPVRGIGDFLGGGMGWLGGKRVG